MTAAAGLAQGVSRMTFAFVLPDMTEQVLGTYSVAGFLGAANLGGYLIGVLVSATLTHIRPTSQVKAGVGLTLLGFALMALSPTVWLLFVGMLTLGMASGIVWIAVIPVVAAHAPSRRRGLAYGLMMSGVGAGIASIGLFVRAADSWFGPSSWRETWLLELAFGGIVLLLLVLLLEPVAGVPRRPRRTGDRPRRLGIHWLFVCYTCFGVSHALFTHFLVAALREDAGFTLAESINVYSLLGLANIVGGLLLGRLSDRVGRRPILVGAMFAISACASTIALAHGALLTSSGVFYGLLMSGFSTVVIAYLGDVVGPDRLPGAYAAITVAIGVGQMVGPPIGGALADVSGSFESTYLLCGLVAAVGGIAATRMADDRTLRRTGSSTTALG
ncbi:YbfB/YjiJ family MFS transporter [Geodermatophilus sabuli]|uniref:YbfB/YjiJ family MFS transporter n=1 Tax=Geodermatophilus sabuli TaxID=1564158 RepID=A0A7K3VW51_9ACTN|nr:MFS transporter [Geodermatophilus sabuli]NEK56866.1 YbfB/YjiJ family MFS transporter [Geodermatophilus sabuli]